MFKAKTKEELKARFNDLISVALDVLQERKHDFLAVLPSLLPPPQLIELPAPISLERQEEEKQENVKGLQRHREENLRHLAHRFHLECSSHGNHIATSNTHLLAFIERAKELDKLLDEQLPLTKEP